MHSVWLPPTISYVKGHESRASDDNGQAAARAQLGQDNGEAEGSPPTPPISRRRLILVDGLITIATLLAIVGTFSLWANRLLLNPDNWKKTSTQLLQNSEIRNTTANYLVDQLYANVNVGSAIEPNLPPQLKPLVDPVAGALRGAAVKVVDAALTRPRIQNLWGSANQVADRAFVTIVEGGRGPVNVQGGAVTLDLASILSDTAARLGLPSDLGSKLPPKAASLTILKSNQLKLVEDVGNAIKGLALWLTILVPLLYGTAMALARGHRRRTLRTVGFAIVSAGVISLLVRSILESQITNSVATDASLRPTVSATVAIVTSMVKEIAGALLLVGIVLIGAAWFAGPMRIAVAGRRILAPYLREDPGWAFATAAGLMLLVFIWNPIPATGAPAGMIVFMALALLGAEALRRQTSTEFSDVRRGEELAVLRGRLRSMRGRRGHRSEAASSTAPPSVDGRLEQLERLAALRDSKRINQEDYDALKATLLHK